ncbi:hypothetical protein EC973_001130 [Apophysomyces ossiformis]|uniref:BZIP domain-containing protein n=1 Tax=Apophysomyces ossiformis TaxID=679940 RepID=A0A8H7BK72_9FUNG|nr:hypothetical protein EC973_001130 [Apophysomyces ossiformis]
MDSYLSNIDTYLEQQRQEEQQRRQWHSPAQETLQKEPPYYPQQAQQQLNQQYQDYYKPQAQPNQLHYLQQQQPQLFGQQQSYHQPNQAAQRQQQQTFERYLQQHEQQHHPHPYVWTVPSMPSQQYSSVSQQAYVSAQHSPAPPFSSPLSTGPRLQASSTGLEPNPFPGLAENGQPIKIRKKPGRKPNPASPALRKAQNRAAQRAFRERKERHLRGLEETIRTLREQRNDAVKQVEQLKKTVDAFKAETWYLKGLALTLRFLCLCNKIEIPLCSPYLSDEDLEQLAKSDPEAVAHYASALNRNNATIDIPAMMEKRFRFLDDALLTAREGNPAESSEAETMGQKPTASQDFTASRTTKEKEGNSDIPTLEYAVKIEKEEEQEQEQEEEEKPTLGRMAAIQQLRLRLRMQSTLMRSDTTKAGLQPTILQLSVPHDPRIDLVPTPLMRDRMILFRNILDHDRCFELLLTSAIYHGGDPTNPLNWELPEEFHREFWYLAGQSDFSSKGYEGASDAQYNMTVPQKLSFMIQPYQQGYSPTAENMPELLPLDKTSIFSSPQLDHSSSPDISGYQFESDQKDSGLFMQKRQTPDSQ